MNILSSEELSQLELSVGKIVKEAGNYILKNWNNISQIKFKDERDLSTNVDIEVESKLKKQLHELLPSAGFIVEEGKTEEKAEFNWTIDPIDGTKNFVHLYPLFCLQVALLFKGSPILGIVFNPVSSQLFSASSKNGAKLNNKIVKVPARENLNSAIVDVDFGGNDSIIDWKLDILARLIKTVYRVRMSGGFANSYMLTGAFDASVYLHQQTKEKYTVDNAPRIILIQEAGFQTDLLEFEDNKKIFIAANKILINELKTIILS